MSDPVKAQYEALPYPPRDPRDEAKRLIVGSPSNLPEIEHYVFGGRLPQRLRVLVAGGGTGDATVMIAQQMADRGLAGEVVYLDWSEASRKIAETRIAIRKLPNVKFVTGSLTDFTALNLGTFDYIDCCGVLHHLDDPPAVLAALARALNPAGGMGLMLYGALGRRGVYDAQAVLAALAEPGDAIEARVDLAKRYIEGIPPTNWLKRNPFVADHLRQGDAGLVDLLLHARDRAYTVPDIEALLAGAGLRLTSYVSPARYEPERLVSDARLKARLARAANRAALAELIAGNIKSHAFYVVAAGNPVTPPVPDDPALIPVPFNVDLVALAAGFKPGQPLAASVDGLTLSFPVPRRAGAMAALIDGKRDLAAIQAGLAGGTPWPDFAAEFAALYAALNGLGKLTLRRA